MKVSLEIKPDEDKIDMLIYSWKLGASEEKGKMVAHADYYQLIVECVKQLFKSRNDKSDSRMNELLATTFINSNIEKAQQIIDNFKAMK